VVGRNDWDPLQPVSILVSDMMNFDIMALSLVVKNE